MKATLLLTVVTSMTILMTGCCKKHKPPVKNVPECINAEIRKMESEPVRSPAGSVWKYNYNGQAVYFIPASCCDMQSVLYNSSCEIICYPDGGFTGAGDGQCSDFFSTRQNEILVWKDDRTN